MRQQLVKIALSVLVSLASLSALCGPMGFKDSWMAMGDISPNWQEVFVNYALTARDAAGATALAMRSDNGTKTRQVTEATYTRLARRWNMPEAQANIWFIGGIGNITGNDFSGSKTLASPGVQVDYETTRVYASATEVRRMRGLTDKTEVTPMLRLIHNRYFVELGVNNASQARMNFMYIFD